MERVWILETKDYKNKRLFKIDDIDANKVSVSKKEPYDEKSSFKYFIEYDDNDVIKPLCIKLPQWLGRVNTLMVIRQCLLRLVIKNC